MDQLLHSAGDIILHSSMNIALTGAGISVESGIPDFRSAGGLWDRFDPFEYATLEAFQADPIKVWEMLHEMEAVVLQAKPNKAHVGLAELEKMGFLNAIITQNVDNLHQAGGARNVIEYHGNSASLSCLKCGKGYSAEEKRAEDLPRCVCGSVLKPDVVFFGETIPPRAMNKSYQLASATQALLVVGTSALVFPANTIPDIAKKNGAKIIEVNKEETHLTSTLTDIFLQGSAVEIVSALVQDIKTRQARG